MDRARAKLGDKVTIPAVVEEIEHTTLGEINYKVVPLNTWFDADEIEALGQTESEDCISRQQAIEAFCDDCRGLKPVQCEHWDKCKSQKVLRSLPPVTPTERTGEWKHTMTYYPYCSECEWMPEEDEMTHGDYNYCPNCGAKMGGDDNE